MVTLKNWYQIVYRTATFGLTESKFSRDYFNKWLAIWALDIICEYHEIQRAKNLGETIDEVGDVMWGVAASAMLLGVDETHLIRFNEVDVQMIKNLDLVDLCSEYADLAKKTARDSRTDFTELKLKLRAIAIKIQADYYPAQLCLDAVDAKLKKRYPNGFNAVDSINRSV